MKTREQIVDRIKGCEDDLHTSTYGDDINGVLDLEILTLKYFFRFNKAEKFENWAGERILMNDVWLEVNNVSPYMSLRLRTENAIMEWMLTPV